MFKHFRPLLGLLPLSSNDDLRRLHMPVLYLAGAHDALVQTQKSAARLAKLVPHAEIHVLEDRGHVVIDMQDVVLDFLLRAMTPGNPRLRNQEPAGRKPSTLGSIRP